MTSVIDFLTAGFQQASGLSLTTGGLLVLSDVAEGARPDENVVPARVDVRLVFDVFETLDADAVLEDGDLGVEVGLVTAILLSLFTDARATDEELSQFGEEEDPRGWCLDFLSQFAGDVSGSKLWLLLREKQTPETLARAKSFAQDALAWLIEDGIADAVNVTAIYPRRGLLGIVVEVVRALSGSRRFAFVWEV